MSCGGMDSSTAGSIFAEKHQQSTSARAGSARLHWLLWPQSGQRAGSDGVFMRRLQGGKGARVKPAGPGCKSVPMGAIFPMIARWPALLSGADRLGSNRKVKMPESGKAGFTKSEDP